MFFKTSVFHCRVNKSSRRPHFPPARGTWTHYKANHRRFFSLKMNSNTCDLLYNVFKPKLFSFVVYLRSWTKLLRKCHILRAFFLTSSLYRVLPSPLPLEAMLLCVLKQPWSLDICRKQHWPGGRGIWYRKSVVVEIVLLRAIVRIHEGVQILK